MGLDVVFGLLLIVFLVAWAGWLFGISRDYRPLVVGGAAAVVGVTVALLLVNSSRVDEQEEAYSSQVIVFMDAVEVAQEESYRADGSYSEELPDGTQDLAVYDDGLLVNERDFKTELTVEGRSYKLNAEIEGLSFTLDVKRTGGGVEQTRTCEGDAASGCSDGSWSPLSQI